MISTVTLIKAHAYGNDFLLVRAAAVAEVADRPPFVRALCERHRGIGADGVIFYEPTAAGATCDLLNADGSWSELSGNGVRCLAAWLAYERGLPPGAMLTVGTGAGAKTLSLLERQDRTFRFRAAMGPPESLREERLQVGDTPVSAVVMRVGNPQCVVLGPATPDRLHTIAAGLAVHPFFPEGTNVELADVEAPDRVRILIWERGVGPTEASGTGACASAVAAAAFGGAGRDVHVVSPGGTQRVEWTPDTIFLTGSATIVGRIELNGAAGL
jgi:diaminopimelate epimerase